MNRLLFGAALLALCASSVAQTWSPRPTYASKPGGGAQYIFGCYPDGRFQLADGNFRNTALVVTKVSMRAEESYVYHQFNGMGRAWKAVSLDIAPTDLATVSPTFSANLLATPTSCFSGAMTWPTLTGHAPDPMSNFPIQIPLTSLYLNPGRGAADMILDFRVTGGTLANSAPWPTATTAGYNTDSYIVSSGVIAPTRYWHDTTTRGCTDSAAPPPFDRAFTVQYMHRYSASFPTPGYRNHLRLFNESINLAPLKPFINVVDLAIDDVGVPFGAGCERLFLKVSPAALYFPAVADARGAGPTNYFGMPSGLVKYDAAWKGLEIYTQSAWSDSVTNAVMLTGASSAEVPEFEFETEAEAKRACVFHHSHGPAGTLGRNFWLNPIIRFN